MNRNEQPYFCCGKLPSEGHTNSCKQQNAQDCIECGGTGKLTRLGGDWGKTTESEVACWRCKGTGRQS